MDVKGVILIETQASENGHAAGGTFAGVPLALLEVLGRAVALRVAGRLLDSGAGSVVIVSSAERAARDLERSAAKEPSSITWAHTTDAQFWRTAESCFVDLAQAGAEAVIVARLGGYAEIDYDDLLQFHVEQGARVTRVFHQGEPLDTFVIAGSRRNDAAFLFRSGLQRFRSPEHRYDFNGFLNPLRGAADLRRLAFDGLMQRIELAPAGQEIKPGVWTGEGARIHKQARVLAPAFIGAHAKIRAAAVVTRGSSIEHHSEIDCGTVVESANVLPYSYVGAGLDVAHAVVGFKHVAHLRRNVEIEIHAPKLISQVPWRAPVRTATSAASLLSFLPVQVARGLFGRRGPELPCDIATAVQTPAPEIQPEPVVMTKKQGNPARVADVPGDGRVLAGADLAIVRRYGNE